MLVLSRKKGESVVVNGNITIVVVDVSGDKARIGIEAPADVAVYRSEVLAKSAAANEGGETTKDGEIDAPQTFRKAKNVGEAPKRGKSGGGRGARKKTVATSVEKRENPVETLYLSSESEAYRRCDAAEETSASSERDAANVGFETVETENNVK
ncbi:MAG: carbon storage regulator [Thermoguttaceae bacterium]|nr:carbon storage regulator [Thermoguttaceae bacterium]